VPLDVEWCIVQLPGREARWREAPYTRVDAVTPALADAVGPLLSDPFVFFGHSLGSLVAFELARLLWHDHGILPRQLVCSAHRAPHLPNRHTTIGHLSDDDFIREVNRRYGGVPAAVLENREVLELMLPGLRADFTMYETYQYREEAPLPCPIAALGGSQDAYVEQAEIEGWKTHTSSDFSHQMLPGDHFFVQAHRGALLESILRALDFPKTESFG
jgi:medium-chain acyl-[acyl-carrier-protein] hydrolase